MIEIASEQAVQLDRVVRGIGEHVLAFCRLRWSDRRPVFQLADLAAFVQERANVAPSSPDRVLRELRRAGFIAYRVQNRAASRYELEAVR